MKGYRYLKSCGFLWGFFTSHQVGLCQRWVGSSDMPEFGLLKTGLVHEAFSSWFSMGEKRLKITHTKNKRHVLLFREIFSFG